MIRIAFVVVLFFVAQGFLIGPGEYADEKLMEKEICKQRPKPEWCGEIQK